VSSFRRALEQRDRGAYAILYATLLTVMVGMAALVLDLANLRLDRRANRAAADSAAIAAAAELGQAASSPRDACEKAMHYAEANLGVTTSGANTCGATFPAAEAQVASTCAAGRKLVAEDVPPYPSGSTPDRDNFRIEVSWPVPDDDWLMTDPDRENSTTIVQGVSAKDGKPCARMGVEVIQQGQFVFAGIFGISGQTTSSHSVGLSRVGETGDVPAPLVVLDRSSCNALVVGGGGGVVVAADPGGDFGGTIAIDSDGSGGDVGCNGGKTVISAPSNNNHLWALDSPTGQQAQIQVFAPAFTAQASSPPGLAYDPSDIIGCTRGGATIADMGGAGVCPIPTPRSNRVTDAPWVQRYNCTQATAADCGHEGDFPAVGPYDFVDQWVDYVTATESKPTTTLQAEGWTVLSGGGCSVSGNEVFADVYADCNTLDIDGTLAVTGRLIVRNDLVVKGCLLINYGDDFGQCATLPAPVITPGQDGGNVYVGGGLSSTGSASTMMIGQAFVYLAGRLDWSATHGLVSWTAPYGSQISCQPAASSGDSPSPACFEDLGLWSPYAASETSPHELGGGADIRVDGTLFMPFGKFEFSGGTVNTQDNAQFVAKRLGLHGSGTLTMVPNIERSTSIPGSGGSLIR
jgi:Putative Flp pilus-assembly TadE/G-like